MPFLQSGTAKICAGMATFAISHSDKLAKLRVVLVQRTVSESQFLLRNGSFLDSQVLWIGKQSRFNSTPVNHTIFFNEVAPLLEK